MTNQSNLTASGSIPKVSVVCITYNHEKFIGDAIAGFLKQKTNFQFEVLIGDDCSPDRTGQIVREAAMENPAKIIAVPRTKNMGAVSNYMDLVSRTRGQYLCICDGDDFWIDEYKLQKQADFLDSNTDFSIVFHPTRTVFTGGDRASEDYDPFKLFDSTVRERGYFTIENLIKINFITALSVMYRWQGGRKLPAWMREFQISDYPTHMMHAARGKIGIINEIMGEYRKHDGGHSWTPSPDDQYKYLRDLTKLVKRMDRHLDYSYHEEFKPILSAMRSELVRLSPGPGSRIMNILGL